MNIYPAICVSVGNEYKFVFPANITHIVAEDSYAHIHMRDGDCITVSKSLKDLESALPEEVFVRVHHSTIINLIYVVCYHQDESQKIELIGKVMVPLSRRKKASFLGKFTKL